MREIKVEKDKKPGGWKFKVTVKDDKGESRHTVRMDNAYFERVARGQCRPEELVEASFHFLLDREPKESILRSFEITTISRYFPEYESHIQSRL